MEQSTSTVGKGDEPELPPNGAPRLIFDCTSGKASLLCRLISDFLDLSWHRLVSWSMPRLGRTTSHRHLSRNVCKMLDTRDKQAHCAHNRRATTRPICLARPPSRPTGPPFAELLLPDHRRRPLAWQRQETSDSSLQVFLQKLPAAFPPLYVAPGP